MGKAKICVCDYVYDYSAGGKVPSSEMCPIHGEPFGDDRPEDGERGEDMDLVHEVTRAMEITLAENGIAFDPVDGAERVGRALTANLIARVPRLRTGAGEHIRWLADDGYLYYPDDLDAAREAGNDPTAVAVRELREKEVDFMADHPDPSTEGDEDLRTVVSDFIEWADETFPEATPESCIAHLKSEVNEELSAPGGARDPEELADAAMLVFHAAHRAGVSLTDALREKLEKNRLREWGPKNDEGFREHVRPDSSTRSEGLEVVKLICPFCDGVWPTTLQPQNFRHCPLCSASFSFRKPTVHADAAPTESEEPSKYDDFWGWVFWNLDDKGLAHRLKVRAPGLNLCDAAMLREAARRLRGRGEGGNDG